ncbi:hypothetical protein ACFFLS_05575 [Flavobacterium procerum]|uniref:Sel1 repeat family protein n=1 Tax=Flavobacterium procerum TaxID=1455569 RepID=A0ABV6BM45_9FLAO
MNPVQQNIEKLVVKWEKACKTKEVNIVCITHTQKEQSMIDAFLEYILAVDSRNKFFVWIFESVFESLETFTNAILLEMQESIAMWNTMKKPEQYEGTVIDWTPEFKLENPENAMQLLINNLNSFAAYLNPEEGNKVCYVFKSYGITKKEADVWIKTSLKNSFHKNSVWTVTQTSEDSLYRDAIYNHDKKIKNIDSEINVNGMLEELVAQADLTNPENAYRNELVKLMHAVEDRKKEKVGIQAKKCLDIVVKQLKNDPNWIAQIVTVYVILYNDQIGYKNYDEALYFADKAVEAAVIAQQTIDESLGSRLAGQAYIGRGSIYVLKDDWQKANADYINAKKAYEDCGDYLMQIESCRLCGWSAEKFDHEINVIPYYEEGFNLHTKIDHQLLLNSNFPLMLKDVIYNTAFEKKVTKKALDELLIPLFGENYKSEIAAYGDPDKLHNTEFK